MNMEIVFCDCTADSISDFPTLTLVIDGKRYYIPPSTYVSTVDNNFFTTCLLDVSYQRGWSVYILGLPLFENYYTVFDQEQKKIGFARSVHSDPLDEDCPHYTALMQKNSE